MSKTIVWDTDLLIKISNDPLPKVNLKELAKENNFIVVPSVLGEILGLAKSANNSTAKRARTTLTVIESSGMFSGSHEFEGKKVPAGETDEVLIELIKAKPKERILGTMDGSLLSRMEKLRLPYMTLSNGRMLFHPFSRGQHI